MPVYPFDGIVPDLGPGTFVAPDATIVGDVITGRDVSFWFQTVARGDVNRITIGDETNIQDGTVLHVTHRTHPLVIGSRVVVGHAAVLHGCTIGDGSLIGIGARVLDGAVVESGAQVGAGALVAPGAKIPSGWLALGIPARPIRRLDDEDTRLILDISERYVALKNIYAESVVPEKVAEEVTSDG